MKLGRPLFNKVFENATSVFEEKILPLPNKVEVKFQSKEEFITAVKTNPLIQQQIELGFYKDIEKEYVGFAVVYAKDNFEMKSFLGLPYTITICDEIAKEVLKPFSSSEIKTYLTRIYIHEMTHIFDKWIKEQRPDLWEECLKETHYNEELANEALAERIPQIALGEKDIEIYNNVEKRLWSKVFARMQQVAKQRGIR